MFDASKLLNQMFGAGGADNPLGQIGGILGGLLNDSVAGMKDGAAAIEQKTGIGAKADATLKGATGKSSGDLFAQAKAFATENKGATGAALGGLGLLLLGTRGGRGLIGNAATLGGLAMVGGLAYRAWQNHQAGNTQAMPGQIEAAPEASPFGVSGNFEQDNATAMLVLRAMIAAAACDGVVDNAERSRIIGALEGAGLDVHAAKFLDAEFAKPATISELAAAANTPALAAQAYTAARIAIEPDSATEKAFLTNLAGALGLDAGLVAQIDAGAAAAKS
jgi:uncharacterized membrane protein YebE (DUF533 family)